eukprot:989803-Rhodomonas_salina.1
MRAVVQFAECTLAPVWGEGVPPQTTIGFQQFPSGQLRGETCSVSANSMKMVARLLVGCCLLVLVAGYEGCNDGTVLLGDSTCSDFVQRRANPVIEIDGYEQHWELLPDDRISARMRMGYTVRSGSASRGFKSITDDADSIDVDSLDVRGP